MSMKESIPSSSLLTVLYDNNNSCLSILTKLFIKEAIYAQITRDEALNACRSVLTCFEISKEKRRMVEQRLFDSLVANQVLIPSSKNIYLIYNNYPQGVLIDFTQCYSPLCKTSSLGCYSPSCPKKSQTNFCVISTEQRMNIDIWTSKIPRSILENLPSKEKKRQLAIEELQSYEYNFLRQLNVIRDVFAQPLLSSSTTIEESRKYAFHDLLFGNHYVLARLHKKILRDLELSRDSSNYHLFPDSITLGNLLLKRFSKLTEPYVEYVSNHVFAKQQYNLEYNRNETFQQFIEQQEGMEREFRIPLKDLLISPIVRMPKYDLLFTTILKNSKEEEQTCLIQLIDLARNIVHTINEATRQAEAEQRLTQIKVGLRVRRPSIRRHSSRVPQIVPDDATLLFEGQVDLIKAPPIPPAQCQLFLFSNALVITRKRNTPDGEEEYTLVDRPIPLHMLHMEKVSRLSSLRTVYQQASILSSIRRQFSHSGSYGSTHSRRRRFRRRWSSNRQAVSDVISVPSDDSLSISLTIHTISGLKIRHRIKTIQQKIKRTTSKTVPLPEKSASFSFNGNQTTPLLQKSATYPSRANSPHMMRSRLLQISHMADPNLHYVFECPSVENRLSWTSKIRSVLPNPSYEPFALEALCATSNYSSLHSVNGKYATGCGTIWCSLSFITPNGRGVIALGTRYGVWVASDDGSEPFKQILPHNCHQLELFNSRILIVRGNSPNRVLGGILIDHIYPSSSPQLSIFSPHIDLSVHSKNFEIIEKSGVIHFAVGTLRGDPILCYLRRRRTGSFRLGLLFYRADNTFATPWFKKFKEYKPLFIQPSELKIIHDYAFILSRSEGVEKVDLSSWVLNSNTTSAFQHIKYSHRIDLPSSHQLSSNYTVDDPALITVGYVSLSQPKTGLICSGKSAFPVADANADLLQQEIEFESEAKTVAVCYPYLIIFSTHVIEIRHLETAALVQAIPGKKIRYLYTCQNNPRSPVIHLSMLHPDQDQTKVHLLYLKEPIVFDKDE